MLTIRHGSHVEKLQLAGNYTGDSFVVSQGAQGTDVTLQVAAQSITGDELASAHGVAMAAGGAAFGVAWGGSQTVLGAAFCPVREQAGHEAGPLHLWAAT